MCSLQVNLYELLNCEDDGLLKLSHDFKINIKLKLIVSLYVLKMYKFKASSLKIKHINNNHPSIKKPLMNTRIIIIIYNEYKFENYNLISQLYIYYELATYSLYII